MRLVVQKSSSFVTLSSTMMGMRGRWGMPPGISLPLNPVLRTVSLYRIIWWGKYSCSVIVLCHPGIYKAIKIIQAQFWWSSVIENTKEFKMACQLWIQSKPSCWPPLPVPLPSLVPQGMDFITGLPSSVFLTIVDLFSKMVHLTPFRKLPSAKGINEILAYEVFRLHEIAIDLVSDRCLHSHSGVLISAWCFGRFVFWFYSEGLVNREN